MRGMAIVTIRVLLLLVCLPMAHADALSDLEDRVTALEESTSSLESWSETIQSVVDFLCSVVPGCDTDDVIVPVDQIACNIGGDCGDDGFVGDTFCFDGDVYQDYRTFSCLQGGSKNSQCINSDVATLKEVCDYGCLSGVCALPPSDDGHVAFRTNVDDNYFGCTSSTGCWIAFDFDGDNALDAMGYSGKSNRCSDGDVLGVTPEGYEIVDYGSSHQLFICDDNGKSTRFSVRNDFEGIETSSLPTEPFTSMGLEVLR